MITKNRDYTLYDAQKICKEVKHDCSKCIFNNNEFGCTITNTTPDKWYITDYLHSNINTMEYLYSKLNKVEKKLKWFPYSRKLSDEKVQLEIIIEDLYKYHRYYQGRNMVDSF